MSHVLSVCVCKNGVIGLINRIYYYEFCYFFTENNVTTAAAATQPGPPESPCPTVPSDSDDEGYNEFSKNFGMFKCVLLVLFVVFFIFCVVVLHYLNISSISKHQNTLF